MLSKPYKKQPWEQETVRVDWAQRITSLPISGFVIAGVACIIFDSSAADVSSAMLEGAPTYSGTYVYLTIKGGTDSNNYHARIRVTLTKDGADTQYQEEDLLIIVKQEGKA